MTRATVQSYRPTQFGFQVRTDKGIYYVPSQLFPVSISAGTVIEFDEHKAGDPYPASFGKEGKFKSNGIHNIFVAESMDIDKKLNAEFAMRSKLKPVLEEA